MSPPAVHQPFNTFAYIMGALSVKRPLADITPETSIAGSAPERAVKRQRQDAPKPKHMLGASSMPPMPLITPPTSAISAPEKAYYGPTLQLQLKIPVRIPDDKEKRRLTGRKAAATRWARQGKLTLPPPTAREIKDAYNLKLMRHYPAPPSDTTNIAREPNFIKPVIHKSPRVTALLRSFPTLLIKAVAPETINDCHRVCVDLRYFNENKRATSSESAVRLAWQNFAVPERETRAAMMESGLRTEDLVKEDKAQANNLPEWKKYRTSRFGSHRTLKKAK